MSSERINAAVLLSGLFLAMVVGNSVGLPEETISSTPTLPHQADQAGSEGPWGMKGGKEDHHDHHMTKRFIWTLTQEPFLYDKYGEGGEGEMGRVDGQLGAVRSEAEPPMNTEMMVPQALPLRNPSTSFSLHKRLYPRWYQAYVYKNPSFNSVASTVGEHKRFQPFHPLARFRGLSLGGSSAPSYRGYDLHFADSPGHRLPTAPNAQPSLKYDEEGEEEEDREQQEEDEEKQLRVGELLHLLKSIAGDRGLSGHTKSFRFGVSRRK